ncbi:MAG: SDR family oxidoreductase [Deltaproteobacteria bacterium]|nr:SDR family oxidoreductase [Nannocystaceae bacterium]
MKIVVIAATGGIGRQIVEQAAVTMHEVVAVARRPTGFPADVRTVAVDLSACDERVLGDAIRGADAVLSGLGPRRTAEIGVAERGTAAIVQAMRVAQVRRLLVVSAAPIGTVASPGRPRPPRHDPGDGFFMRHLLAPIVKTVLREHYRDLACMEDVLRDSGLDWTAVRPPQLDDRPCSGEYRFALDRNVPGGLKIGRADVAHLMLAAISQRDTVGHTIGVAY